MEPRASKLAPAPALPNEASEGLKTDQVIMDVNDGDRHIDAVRLQNVIIESKIKTLDAQQQAEAIAVEFNKDVKKDEIWFTRSNIRGRSINPGEFILGALNKQSMLATYQSDYRNVATQIKNPLSKKTELGNTVRSTDPYYGLYGKHVLNVPVDKYVKAISANKPVLFGPGSHVIHDPNLRFKTEKYNPAEDQVDILSDYIDHHTIHILRVAAGKVAAVWIGNVPLLLPARAEPYVFDDKLFRKAEQLFIDQSSPYIHHGTINIIRVPQGKVARVWVNNEAQLLPYSDKPYIFKTPYFKIEQSEGNYFFDQATPYIQHGNTHIVRVPQGKVAKVWVNNEARLLPYSDQPYKFETAYFKIERNNHDYFVDQSLPYIQHGNIHILRVPQGKVAKVWVNNEAKLLPYSEKPYSFETPYFKIEMPNGEYFTDQSEAYIQHGNIHVLRVPKGKIAKVWIDNKPELLEHQDKPYQFETPYFKLEPDSRDDLFCDATKQTIVLGHKKRLIPHTGEVAITYDNGTLKIIKPASDSKAILIESPTHEFVGFLSTNIQTLVFPSEKTKMERKKDNPKAEADEIALEVFQTRDSLSVGVKLLVAYRIFNPELAVSQLGKDGIIPHVENLATVDMGKAIKQCSSQDFLTFFKTKPTTPDTSNNAPVIDTQPRHIQDIVKDDLAKDLSDYGIELVRLNIETTKTLNRDIREQMEQQARGLAETNAKEAALSGQTRIIIAESNQRAEAARIAQDQQNNATRSKAQAELEAAQLRAQALLLTAEAEQKAAALQGKQYRDYPELVKIRQAELQSAAMSKAPMMISPQMMPGMGMYGTPFPMFNPNMSSNAPNDEQLANEGARKNTPSAK